MNLVRLSTVTVLRRGLKISGGRLNRDESMDDLVGALLDGATATRDIKNHIDVQINYSTPGQ